VRNGAIQTVGKFCRTCQSLRRAFFDHASWTLERTELDEMVQRLTNSESPMGTTWKMPAGSVLTSAASDFCNWAGPIRDRCSFVRVSTEWYERYQRLLEVSDEFGGLTMDEPDQDEEN